MRTRTEKPRSRVAAGVPARPLWAVAFTLVRNTPSDNIQTAVAVVPGQNEDEARGIATRCVLARNPGWALNGIAVTRYLNNEPFGGS